jgi:hypothetical protein
MSSLHSSPLSSNPGARDGSLNLDFLQNFATSDDPVEAYFECITQCSLDDGECVTVCTSILREHT